MIARVLTALTGVGLQLAGVYAAVATFGAWFTLGLYAVGVLAVVLQHVAFRRTTWSPGD